MNFVGELKTNYAGSPNLLVTSFLLVTGMITCMIITCTGGIVVYMYPCMILTMAYVIDHWLYVHGLWYAYICPMLLLHLATLLWV